AELCPKCKKPVLLQNSSRGLFVGCSGYPDCDYTEPFGAGPVRKEPLVIGKDPATKLAVLLLVGPYGPYVQLGETVQGALHKPKRAAWPKNVSLPTEASAEALTVALKALALPRHLGNHPETGKPVEANVGRFGPYVKHDGAFKSIPKSDSVYDITLPRAVELLAEQSSGAGRGGRRLGSHPDDQRAVTLHSGRYGPYVKHGSTNATIPASLNSEAINLEQALELLAAKSAKSNAAKPAKRKSAGTELKRRGCAP
ncbi:MAG: topoisomerase C-terminal repeat-containing protein, partial [Burkholderiales bacterium]